MLRLAHQQQQANGKSGWDTSSLSASLHKQPFPSEDLCKVGEDGPVLESCDLKIPNVNNNNKISGTAKSVELTFPAKTHNHHSCDFRISCSETDPTDGASCASQSLIFSNGGSSFRTGSRGTEVGGDQSCCASSVSGLTSSSSLSTNSWNSSTTASWPSSATTCSRRSAIKKGRASSCSSLSTKRSNISFGSVSVHTHNVALGDNPSETALDWKNVKSERYNLDEFEEMSKGRPKRPSRIQQEAIPEEWLKQNGHSGVKFKEALEAIDVVKAGKCLTKMDLDPLDEYHVLANVSLREQRRQARLDAATSAAQKKKTKAEPFYSRWSRRVSTPN